MKLELKDAYFTVPVWKGHQKYLRFLWKETLCNFACLPFGLASAPGTFTKIMKPVVATFRNLGIRLIIYLDDLLILADSEQTAPLHLATSLSLLENLGFVINQKESVLSPGGLGGGGILPQNTYTGWHCMVTFRLMFLV